MLLAWHAEANTEKLPEYFYQNSAKMQIFLHQLKTRKTIHALAQRRSKRRF